MSHPAKYSDSSLNLSACLSISPRQVGVVVKQRLNELTHQDGGTVSSVIVYDQFAGINRVVILCSNC